MPLADFPSPVAWVDDLDRRWPERLEMSSRLIDAIDLHLEGIEAQDGQPAQVVELGVGDGRVLDHLLKRHPDAHFTGVDINPTLLKFVAEAFDHNPRTRFVEQDLGRIPWSTDLPRDCAVVYSLQSLHDVGGRDLLHEVYRQAAAMLAPGGILLNADFVVPQPQDDPANPRRLPIDVHLELMDACGFEQAEQITVKGMLGCVKGTRP